MKNFLLGTVVGTMIGYVFFKDIDNMLRQGVNRANEGPADSPSEPMVPPHPDAGQT